MNNLNEIKNKYYSQKARAKIRGIEFKLTFNEWWDIWQTSGKWEQRGKRAESYQMARYNDTGPYSVSNVYITKMKKNISFANKQAKHPNFKGIIKGINIKDGTELIFTGSKQIEEAGFSSQAIYHCCNKTPMYKTHKGYTWERQVAAKQKV